jgi:cellobiose transport system substrate-binding protein
LHALTRRKLLALAAAGGGLLAAGCGETTEAATDEGTTLWSWPGGLSAEVVKQTAAHFAGRTALRIDEREGAYREQLAAVLSGGGDVPAIVGIKGEDIASFLPRADLFTDLHELGVDAVMGDYVSWKWQQASAPDNRLIGFPIDVGPTAMYYRADLFARAGLPAETGKVAARIRTWDDFLEAGRQLVKALPGVSLIRNAAEQFTIMICQGTTRYIDETNHYIGNEEHIRRCWDTSVRLVEHGLGAAIPARESDRYNERLRAGKVACALGAAWLGYDIKTAAPGTSGSWRVAAGPASGANYGGSFLAIPTAAADKTLSYDIISWLLAPDRQAQAFTDAALFPAAKAAFTMPALTKPDPFFGGQRTAGIFTDSVSRAHRVYEAPADATVHQAFIDQLEVYESGRKSKSDAYRDAVANGRAIADSMGVN